MSDPKNTYYFIVNPRAGSGKTMRKWLPAEKKLERDGIPFVTALTDHKRHATQLAMKAAPLVRGERGLAFRLLPRGNPNRLRQ